MARMNFECDNQQVEGDCSELDSFIDESCLLKKETISDEMEKFGKACEKYKKRKLRKSNDVNIKLDEIDFNEVRGKSRQWDPEYVETKDEKDENRNEELRKWKNYGVAVRKLKIGKFIPNIMDNHTIKIKYDYYGKKIIIFFYEYKMKCWKSLSAKEKQEYCSKKHKHKCIQTIITEFEKFKTSKIMKLEIDLKDIDRIRLTRGEKIQGSGLLSFDVSRPPRFFHRFIIGKWEERDDFSPNKEISKSSRYYVAGLFSRLLKMLAFMYASDEWAKKIILEKDYSLKDEEPAFTKNPHEVEVKQNYSDEKDESNNYKGEIKKETEEVLIEEGFLKENLSFLEKRTHLRNFSNCFADACEKYTTGKILSGLKLKFEYKGEEKDENCPKTVGELLLKYNGVYKNTYFSFCTGEFLTGDNQHCTDCHKCNCHCKKKN